MKEETAKKIVHSAIELNLDVELYEEYSGRSMYGESTTGVSGTRDDIIEAANAAGISWRGFSWDSMGKYDSIAY